MTYITGTAAYANEYTPNTIRSLAKYIDSYVISPNTHKNTNQLNIKPCVCEKNLESISHIMSDKNLPKLLENINLSNIKKIYDSLKGGHLESLNDLKVKSLIHNDIYPRNILIDPHSKRVISLIDWDHGCYGSPLKDVSDAVAIFYDYLSPDKTAEYKALFIAHLRHRGLHR